MCIFSRPVDLVGSTRILVSGVADGRHATLYQMAYAARADVAMILPVPARPGGDDAVRFVDLGAYRDFFDDLERCCFPVPKPSKGGSGGGYGVGSVLPPRPRLVVHEVGDFLASFVPTPDDFDRLEPCFRLPTAAWETLPDYAGFGFAVFQLQPGRELRETHPLAYTYDPARPEELFFPTAHLHDGGRARALARFDHALYAQPPRQHPNPLPGDLEFGPELPARGMDLARCRGLLAGDRPVGRLLFRGRYPNADVVMQIADPGGPPYRAPTMGVRPARVPLDMASVMS